jgi:ABC-type amino acid transport substrate-binding protein
MQGLVGAAVIALALTACATQGGGSNTKTSKATESVKLVYITGGMPYFGLTGGGGLTGVDGDLLKEVEKKLNVKFVPSVAQFPAFLAGIQSGRYNIGVGGVAWTKERAATGLFTDPLYYSPIVIMCKKGLKPDAVDKLSGLDVGTAAGTLQDSAFRALKDVKTHTYPSSDTALQDLISGRIDCFSDDTLTMTYIQKKRPDLQNFDISVIAAPTDEQITANPSLSDFSPYMVTWYLSKDEAPLVKRLNTVIDSWYTSGFTAKVLKKWGVHEPQDLLTPIPAFETQRRGVDRPDDWTAPSA